MCPNIIFPFTGILSCLLSYSQLFTVVFSALYRLFGRLVLTESLSASSTSCARSLPVGGGDRRAVV